MRIYTPAGDLAFKTFTFPDGQPHFILETYEREFQSVVIEMAIKSPSDLFLCLMANDVLRQHGYSEISLDIRYLMGARMDRAISSLEPFSLQLVARLLNGGGFTKIRILDAHSEVATRLIRNSVNALPFKVVEQVLTTTKAVPICPDKGAVERVKELARKFVKCLKTRDMATGALSGFAVTDDGPLSPKHLRDNNAVIIDDICDGGGTFVGLAKELRKAGAKKVFLYVTHGIFSKGLPLEGIDHVYTTDTLNSLIPGGPFSKGDYARDHVDNYLTVIPISMEKL